MTNASFEHNILNDNSVVIHTGKQLDNNNAHEMVEKIVSIQLEEYKFIIIDMQELEFISSAGVGSILGTIETSREMGGDIIISNASDPILQVLEVLDLAEYLTISSDETKTAELCGSKG